MFTPENLRQLATALRPYLDALDKEPATPAFETPCCAPFEQPINTLPDERGRMYEMPAHILDSTMWMKKERMLSGSLLSLARVYYPDAVTRSYPAGKRIETTADAIFDYLGGETPAARDRIIALLRALDEASAPF